MADDRRDEEQEFKITVRDRRRVTVEGDVREVADEPAVHASEPAPPAAEPPVAPPVAESAPPPAESRRMTESPRREGPGREVPRRPRSGGGALGGADEARMRRDEGRRLREVPPEDAAEEGAEGEMPQIRDVADYLMQVTGEMLLWTLSGLGLMPNPVTRLVATDMDKAMLAVDAAESLMEVISGTLAGEEQEALRQSFVLQFASVAAQLLQQPPQVRLQEIQKIRFCIDTADRFLKPLTELDATNAQTAELQRAVNGLKLQFLQVSGGGSIIG